MDHDSTLDYVGPNSFSKDFLEGFLKNKLNSPKQATAKWKHFPKSLNRDDFLVEAQIEKRKADENNDLGLEVFRETQSLKKSKSDEEGCGEGSGVSRSELEIFSYSKLGSVVTIKYVNRMQWKS